VARYNHPETDKTYAAAQRWVDAALRSDDSLFSPGSPVWTPELIDDLCRRFIDHPDTSSDDFLTKFERQLAGENPAVPRTVQLAGELLFIHFLIANDVGGKRKREIVSRVLGWSAEPVPIPPDLASTLDVGIAAGGPGFNMARPDYLRYLLTFARDWKRLSETEQVEALGDPWAFEAQAYAIDGKRAWGQREALLHLVHPDSFERINSNDVKNAIATSLRGRVPDPDPDRDKLLLQIRTALEDQFGKDLDFYDTPAVHTLWESPEEQSGDSPWDAFIYWSRLFHEMPDFDAEERDYKLVIADRLKRARELLLAGDAEWLPELKKAFGPPNNLTYWRSNDAFLKWCAAEPDAAEEILRRFWAQEGEARERIDQFRNEVPASGQGDSPLPVPAFLLAAWRPEDWPVYRYRPFRIACLLTGYTMPPADSSGDVYDAALAYWDRLIHEAKTRGLELRDRLDAQSVMWCVTQLDPPTHWPEAQRAALLKYRGQRPKNPQPRTGDDQSAAVDIYTFIRSRGYSFPDWLVTDYLISLATKPLVLLCGISGTGKTKLAQLVADFVAPQTMQSVVDTPELELRDTEFTVTLSAASLRTPAYMIPARAAKLFSWPDKGSGADVAVEWNDQHGSARLNNIAYDFAGKSNGISLSFRADFRDWLKASDAKVEDVLRLEVLEGDPPRVRVALVRSSRRDAKSSSAHVAFISVRPDWTDNRSLLGYLNPLTGQYSPTELLRLLLRARQHPDEPHFAILDEMNLAKVEYYFSDFLSAMESGTEMVLHDSTEEVTVELDGTQVTVPRRLQIPRNVFFTGTVNVDETTYMFSPKVLDRANVIEFHDVNLRAYAAGAATADGDEDDTRLAEGEDLTALLKHPGGAYEWARPSDFAAMSTSAQERLLDIHDLLARHNLHFGYRVANEVARFMNLVDTHVGSEGEAAALDLQLLQKVLPKLAGNAARLEQPLLELYADIALAEYPAAPDAACHLPRTAAKIGRMLEALHAVGFASFVE